MHRRRPRCRCDACLMEALSSKTSDTGLTTMVMDSSMALLFVRLLLVW